MVWHSIHFRVGEGNLGEQLARFANKHQLPPTHIIAIATHISHIGNITIGVDVIYYADRPLEP